ncbi:MAG TPA: hypothetical protein DCM07_07080 [Planctomycetaceae bacterium]|uniref:DUF4230 domain-containing protein n=1 Tax=Gimesia sp. TaxID=2024833 RepID=UPI000C60BA7C|nr:DUF4230 domain-containing protein [Gimesia sp.]MAX36773.1 hypothetical protein [Gimesia sp.]HAH44611.1 hypothetical protein [Planctomycetaceae bacterium]|tara:strand:+ start:7353 stop:7949 length:597 start_codon:yes stop_codon:yes gene_type:complete
MNKYSFITSFIIFAVVFGAGYWIAYGDLSGSNHPPVPPITRILALNDLATLRVQIADSITGNNEHWEARWMLHGEAILGVDLSQATYKSVDKQNRKATLSLPAPHVISSKVDHHRSAEIGVKQKTWLPSPGLKSLRDEVWQHADEKVAQLANHDGYLEATKLQAEHVLNKLFQDVGWSVSYEWKFPNASGAEVNHSEG